jgi:hypothetical protein
MLIGKRYKTLFYLFNAFILWNNEALVHYTVTFDMRDSMS